jgi:hypothetical protein
MCCMPIASKECVLKAHVLMVAEQHHQHESTTQRQPLLDAWCGYSARGSSPQSLSACFHNLGTRGRSSNMIGLSHLPKLS